jgi:DNA-binding response OmpR family regulator
MSDTDTPAPETQTSTVLVLDGDTDRLGLLDDVVARAGGETVQAATGAEAIEQLQDGGAHALLVAGLPDGSRRGFVSWARPRFPDLAIVAIAVDAQEATDLYNAGADIVTTLPLDPDLLGAKLAAALRRSRRPHLRLV